MEKLRKSFPEDPLSFFLCISFCIAAITFNIMFVVIVANEIAASSKVCPGGSAAEAP